MTRFRLISLAACVVLLTALPAGAQSYYGVDDGRDAIGLRLGYTSWDSVGQVHFGAHVRMGEVAENLSLTPSFEVGLGDNLTVAALNGDLTWSFSDMTNAPWGLYAGGSLGLIWVDPDGGSSDSNLGLSALIGLTRNFENGHDALLEARVGVLDSPGLKVTFGYSLF